MCAITNEYAGSDGDIFSHSWKLMNLEENYWKKNVKCHWNLAKCFS